MLWEPSRILIRRSHSLGDEVMRTTKQERRCAIDLPEEATDVLRWHVRTQLRTAEQEQSDLLFPAINGKFRSRPSSTSRSRTLRAEVALGKRITQRALRRTFNDLARAARVDDLVTRWISGHLTERMQHHDSTVSPAEQREALRKVLRPFAGHDRALRGEGRGRGGEGRSPNGEGTKKAG